MPPLKVAGKNIALFFFAEIYIRIGDIYYTGDSGEQNDELAFEYYQKATEYNYNKAKMLLGRMYYLGRGTEKDLTTAYRYFWDVATGEGEFLQGICVNPSAFYLTGQMVEIGDFLTAQIKPRGCMN